MAIFPRTILRYATILFMTPTASLLPWQATAAATQDAAVTVETDGTINLPPFSVPVSSYLSPQGKLLAAQFFKQMSLPASKLALAPPSGTPIEEQRRSNAEFWKPPLDRTKALYPVNIETAVIAGVRADIITPRDGVDPKNKSRVLINLHGGGFSIGFEVNAALASIPLASIGKIKIITLDYRQGPESKFPAASEDVAAVYRELLKSYKPENIGIYGCSSGGLLTAEAVAWIDKEKLPRPGAIGIFCSGASGWTRGDSSFLAPIGFTSPATTRAAPPITNVAYFSGVDPQDPLVLPANSADVIAKFPPTLVLTSTRDGEMSSALDTHTKLVRAGVEAELHVWDGLPHGFLNLIPDLPEAKEAWLVAVKFFDSHLGVKERRAR